MTMAIEQMTACTSSNTDRKSAEAGDQILYFYLALAWVTSAGIIGTVMKFTGFIVLLGLSGCAMNSDHGCLWQVAPITFPLLLQLILNASGAIYVMSQCMKDVYAKTL